MAFKMQARTIDAATTVDLDSGNFSVIGDTIEFEVPAMTEAGTARKRIGEYITDADWQTRTLSWLQMIDAADIDTLWSSYRSLLEVITQPRWELVFNSGGATEADKYYDCYSLPLALVVTKQILFANRGKVDISVTAKPFARKAAVQLPRNYILDAPMSESWDGTGVPNSFVLANSAAPPNYRVSTRSDEDGKSYTRIEVNGGGAAGEYAGIRQSRTAPGGDRKSGV